NGHEAPLRVGKLIVIFRGCCRVAAASKMAKTILAIMWFPRFSLRYLRRVPVFATARLQSRDCPPSSMRTHTADSMKDFREAQSGWPLRCGRSDDPASPVAGVCCSQDRGRSSYDGARNGAVRMFRSVRTHTREETHRHSVH